MDAAEISKFTFQVRKVTWNELAKKDYFDKLNIELLRFWNTYQDPQSLSFKKE